MPDQELARLSRLDRPTTAGPAATVTDWSTLYGYEELGVITTAGGADLRGRLMPALDLDRATIEVRVDGVPRATTQIGRRSILSADAGTIRQLENRVSSLPKLAADVEERRKEALTRIEQAGIALAEPFKHADVENCESLNRPH